ncbi:TetR/AcrR family transcriptional regulator [Smaragdicoccus niigatensis]
MYLNTRVFTLSLCSAFVKMFGVTTEKPYAGKLADERRAERRERLVAAGFDLLGTEGTAGTSVRAVCARAGLSSRYFYESFANIDELLVAVFDDVTTRTLGQSTQVFLDPGATIESAVRAVGETFVVMSRDERAMRIGFIEAWGSEAVMRRRVAYLHGSAQLLSTFACEKSGVPSDRRAGVDVAAFMVVGGLLEAILGWIDGSLDVDGTTLVKHFTPAAVAAIERAIADAKREN